MKTNFSKSKLSFALITLASLAIAVSCKKNKGTEETPPTDTEVALTKDEMIAIVKAGFSPFTSSKAEGGYLIEGDVFMTAAQLAAEQKVISNSQGNPTTEQYRTTNILSVGTGRVLKIKVTGSGSSLTVFTNATTEALRRYNALNLKLSFRLLTNNSTETPDISISPTVFEDSNTLGQSADFPSNGNPGNNIKLKSTLSGSNNYIASIVAHEIGHAIGFRHTDYMNRKYSGCPSFPPATVREIARLYPGRNLNNEADVDFILKDMDPTYISPGAVWIPGTPTGPDPNSWMLACIAPNANRIFTTNDITALKTVYSVK